MKQRVLLRKAFGSARPLRVARQKKESFLPLAGNISEKRPMYLVAETRG
ncbi:MAG: hypothetical protein M0R76_12080 [Proteobacteria bacterium]|nr:hypothetical protein [Pseudomonadota bacterium]